MHFVKLEEHRNRGLEIMYCVPIVYHGWGVCVCVCVCVCVYVVRLEVSDRIEKDLTPWGPELKM